MSAEDEGFTDMNPPPDTGIFNNVDRHSSSVIQIDNGKALNVVAVCAAFCGLCLGVSMWSAYTARDAKTESRLAQYYLLELDAKMISAGVKPESESVAKRESHDR
jgi:hypothetical protein